MYLRKLRFIPPSGNSHGISLKSFPISASFNLFINFVSSPIIQSWQIMNNCALWFIIANFFCELLFCVLQVCVLLISLSARYAKKLSGFARFQQLFFFVHKSFSCLSSTSLLLFLKSVIEWHLKSILAT